MDLLLLISSTIIFISAIYNILRSLNQGIKSAFESSRELYEAEAEKLLLSNIKIPVSIILSPHEDYEALKKVIEGSLEVNHPNFEVLVPLNKNCAYLNKLISDFSLVKIEAVYRMVIKSAPINGSYRSTKEKRLKVILTGSEDKASIINTGIDVASYPFICILSEDYIPSKDLLLLIEPPIITDEKINSGAICSRAFYEGMKTIYYYINSIFSYSSLLSLSIPADFAILLKKRFITEKKGMKKGETLPEFIRRMLKEGLRLRYIPDVGYSLTRQDIFLKFLIRHLKKIIYGKNLSSLAILANDIYYLAFITLNVLFFYRIFLEDSYNSGLLLTIILMFVIIPLKDIIALISENFSHKKVDNQLLAKAILFSIIKQAGIEQIIAVTFLILSIKRFIIRGATK